MLKRNPTKIWKTRKYSDPSILSSYSDALHQKMRDTPYEIQMTPTIKVGVFRQIQSLKNYFLATAAFSLEPAVSFTP